MPQRSRHSKALVVSSDANRLARSRSDHIRLHGVGDDREPESAFVLALAEKGWKRALADDPHLRAGLNVAHGQVTYEAVARDLGYAYVPAQKLLT